MGSLHQGHEILIERAIEYAKSHGNRCVVSIFVNPTQFNEQSDFDQYPRDLDADARICKRLGVDVVFAPIDPDTSRVSVRSWQGCLICADRQRQRSAKKTGSNSQSFVR